MNMQIDLNWISPQARSQQVVDSFGITSVGIANLIADLAAHLPEKDLAPIRDKAASLVQFLGEISPLVTPEVVVPAEEERPARIDPVVTPSEEEKKPAPKPSKKPVTQDDVLQGIFSGMGAQGAAAAKAMGVTQKAPAAKSSSPAPTAPAQILREMARVKAVSNKSVTAPNAQIPAPGQEDLKKSALVLMVLQEEPKSEYEAASVLCEIWRKA